MLNEDPHEIIYKGKLKSFLEDETYAIGFDENFEPYIGKPGRAHGDLTGYDDPPDDRPDFFYPGRIWKDEKVISFWRYPSKYQLYKLLERIEGEFKRRFPNKDPLDFSSGGWKVEFWENEWEDVPEENPGGETVNLVSLSNYRKPGGTGKGRSHAPKLNEKSLKKIVRENVKSILESPDGFKIGGKKITFVDNDAYGFGFDFEKSETYIAKKRHDDFHNVDEYSFPEGIRDLRDYLDYPGRFWKDRKIISFWKYPNQFQMDRYLKKLEKEFKKRFPDEKPLNFSKDGWKIEKWNRTDGHIDLIPLSNYSGFGTTGGGSVSHTTKLVEEKKLRNIIRDLIRKKL